MSRKRKRSIEPIAPANIPGERLDPRLPADVTPPAQDERVETDDEQQARDSDQAFDRAATRIPPG